MTQDSKDAVLLSADFVGAYYYVESETLEVVAVGVTSDTTSNIRIEQEPWPGALKFAIKGDLDHWAGFKAYNAQTTLKTKIPSPALPGKIVLVEDAENPGGQQVKIKFLGLG